jgi:hypothetical protein
VSNVSHVDCRLLKWLAAQGHFFCEQLWTAVIPAIFNPVFAKCFIFNSPQQFRSLTASHRQVIEIHVTH